MKIEPDVLAGHRDRLAGVHADAHLEHRILRPWVRPQRPLRGYGADDRVACPGKGHQQAVARGIDLPSTVLGERSTDDPPLVGEGFRITSIAQPLQESRGSLDIGEDKSDGPDGRTCHEPYPQARVLMPAVRAGSGKGAELLQTGANVARRIMVRRSQARTIRTVQKSSERPG